MFNVTEFSACAVRIGELAADAVNGDTLTAAQWLLPRLGDAPERGSIGSPEDYEPTVRALAAFVMSNPRALALVREWAEKDSPGQDPFRFVKRWLPEAS